MKTQKKSNHLKEYLIRLFAVIVLVVILILLIDYLVNDQQQKFSQKNEEVLMDVNKKINTSN